MLVRLIIVRVFINTVLSFSSPVLSRPIRSTSLRRAMRWRPACYPSDPWPYCTCATDKKCVSESSLNDVCRRVHSDEDCDVFSVITTCSRPEVSWRSDNVGWRDIFWVRRWVFCSEHDETVLTHSLSLLGLRYAVAIVRYALCFPLSGILVLRLGVNCRPRVADSLYMMYVIFNLLSLYMFCCPEACKVTINVLCNLVTPLVDTLFILLILLFVCNFVFSISANKRCHSLIAVYISLGIKSSFCLTILILTLTFAH